MIQINQNSDFKIIERRKGGKQLACVPFKFTYFVSLNSVVHTAEYDGKNYVGCSPTKDGLGIIVAINDCLGIGSVKVNRKYSVPDNSYKDKFCNVTSNEEVGIQLTDGATDTVVVENEVILPFEFEHPRAQVVEDKLIAYGIVDNSVFEAKNCKVANNILYL